MANQNNCTGRRQVRWPFQAVVTVMTLLALTACAPQPTTRRPTQRPLTHQLAATNCPLAFFTQEIIGDVATVEAIVPGTQAAIGSTEWRPSGAQIAAMQNADVIFTNGSAAPFAKWLPHVTLPDSRVVQTANDGLKLSEMIAVRDVRIVHRHGPEGEHSHATMVARTWLDPALARKQAHVIADRLAAIYPAEAASIGARLRVLNGRFEQLQRKFDVISTGSDQPQTVITSTPDLKFFTRALQLTDAHLQWFERPSPAEATKQLLLLKERSKSAASTPRFMLFTREPPPELKTAVESAGLVVIVIDSIEGHSNGDDYFDTMARNLERIAPIFADRGE